MQVQNFLALSVLVRGRRREKYVYYAWAGDLYTHLANMIMLSQTVFCMAQVNDNFACFRHQQLATVS